MFSKAGRFVVAAALSHTLSVVAVVHEKLGALPMGWSEAAPADEGTSISLTIGLAQQNIDQLESRLMAVSTPGNSEYGNYLDVDEVNSLFAPTPEAITSVQSWLQSAGVSDVHTDSHFVTFATTVGTANSLLNTTFSNYQNSGFSKLRTTEYSVPDHLLDYIDLISPTTYFGKTVASNPGGFGIGFSYTSRNAPSKVSVDTACQTSITPTCIKELYNVGSYTPDAKSGSRVGFGSFLNQSALYSDLFQYEKFFNIPQQNFSTILINGATNDQDPKTAQIGEANLDVQNIIGVSHPLPVTEFITGGSPPFIPNLDEAAGANTNEPYLPYYQYLLSQPNSALPQVISNSYGDDEQTVPKLYAVRVCNMIGMLGLRGISVLESSGDTGIGAPCKSNDGKNATQFTPAFPGTCPYITAVGGTQAVGPEVAWVDSTGGFSNYFSQPLYQKLAVQNYLRNHISAETKKYYAPYTNFKGRGFPDISAHSLTPDYQVVYAGKLSPSGGTSAAAPVVAGILGLLNDARLRAGKGPLGFINPLLYAIGSPSLNDITGGGSVGCNGVNGQTGQKIPGGGIVPYASWNATLGWDPVTGLGTPDFEKLKKLILSI
ncbi:vesicle formation at the endoplasmic reticulum [Cadophora sp. M221]|nr:vesicle formation at the endoplasmic reticulum [Cadophora sp. M221]